jgi:phenylalanyl-tRNA synthetase beta chain
MRTTLIPGMLETAQRNISRQQTSLRLFEVGKVFLPRPEASLPTEKEMLAGLWTGPRVQAAWHTKEAGCDFFDIKGVVEGMAQTLGIAGFTFTALPDDQCCYSRAGRSAQVLHDGVMVGVVGEVDASVADSYSLRQATFVFELDLEIIAQLLPDDRKMAPIPRFPSTDRDITVIVDRDVESSRLLDAVTHSGEQLVEDLYLFDVFDGDPIPDGKKSVSLRIIYRSAERTLEDETVNEIHHHLTHRLITEFGAALPT